MNDKIRDSKIAHFCRGIRDKSLYSKKIKNNMFIESSDLLKKFKGIHEGERCFIIATGPSLNMEDINMISNEYTFSVNSIIKMFNNTSWRPTYYCISDRNVWNTLHTEVEKADLDYVFFEGSYGEYNNNNGIPFYQCSYPRFFELSGIGSQIFSDDISRVIYAGSTVVYTVLQIAVYMGFKKIYLLGTDCNYSISGNNYSTLTNYDLKEPSAARKTKENGSFVNNIFSDYYCAKDFAKNHGIEIYNCTRGGMLEVFDRIELESLF